MTQQAGAETKSAGRTPPERLDRFMGRATAAYYAARDPFGDFTTAPEISQVFGELLGLWMAEAWQGAGCPDPALLIEAGPGRGTLMSDASRALIAAAPAFLAAARLGFIETSPRFLALLRERFPDAALFSRLEEVPERALFLIANEFLDALPIRQFVRRGRFWAERYVGGGRFFEQPAFSPGLPKEAPENEVIEIGEAAATFVAETAARIVRWGGAALFFDYGHTGGRGDSLQAIRAGRPADPLAACGETDITAHVDFAALALAARRAGAAVFGPEPQGKFLIRLGLFQRSERLARGKDAATVLRVMAAAERLAEPHAMGRLFKVLAVLSPHSAGAAGFFD